MVSCFGNPARLAFLNAKSLVRQYANPAAIPQKISNNFSLHQVCALLIQNGEQILFERHYTRKNHHVVATCQQVVQRLLRSGCSNVVGAAFNNPGYQFVPGC